MLDDIYNGTCLPDKQHANQVGCRFYMVK